MTLLAAAALTVVLVSHARWHGKLLSYPTYDDIYYLADGAKWLTIAAGGPVALVKAYLLSPPHAPVHTAIAAAALAVMGPVRWGPYLLDAVWVWMLLGLVVAVARKVSIWGGLSVGVLAMMTPVAWSAVLDFRPDAACGLASAGGVFLLCDRAPGQISARRRRIAGALFGLALLLKPSVFPLTLGLAGSAILLAGVGRRMWTAAWPVVVAALLYYPFAARQIFQYIMVNTVGPNGPLWQPVHGWDAATYYLTGPGGVRMLGDQLYFLLVIVAVGAAVVLAPSMRSGRVGVPAHRLGLGRAGGGRVRPPYDGPEQRSTQNRLLILGGMTLLAYLLATLNPTKNEFLGAAFQSMLLLAAVAAAGVLLRTAGREPRGKLLAGGVAGLIAAGSVAFGARLETLNIGQARQVQRYGQTVDEVLHVIAPRLGPHEPAEVFVTSAGVVNQHVLAFAAFADGVAARFTSLEFDATIDDYQRQFNHSDWVIATEPGNLDVFRYIPSGGVQGQVLAELKARPDYRLIARVDPGYLIFQRKKTPPAPP